jgi:hypothetical protein
MMRDDIDIDVKSYAIGGKMIGAKIIVSEEVMMHHMSDEDAREAMRLKLTAAIAQQMINDKLVEINQAKDYITGNTTIVARAYVAPDNQVKLLRTYG